MVQLRINGVLQTFDGDSEMPLLWYLREIAGLKGTKFGCGIAQCGACTVHLNGVATRSCVVPMAAVDGSDVRTIEGLAKDDGLHPVQQAWIDEDVPQCGYCQAGQIMAAVDLLRGNDDPSDEDIAQAVTNICRCGTYTRIRKAIKKAARDMRDEGAQ
ncbi:MAG: (2Fe-2S)-binding protein [Pseudomonadota bacterium]